MRMSWKLREKRQAETLIAAMDSLLATTDFAGLKKLIEEKKIRCSVSGTKLDRCAPVQPHVLYPAG